MYFRTNTHECTNPHECSPFSLISLPTVLSVSVSIFIFLCNFYPPTGNRARSSGYTQLYSVTLENNYGIHSFIFIFLFLHPQFPMDALLLPLILVLFPYNI